jgi:hypothetical protein
VLHHHKLLSEGTQIEGVVLSERSAEVGKSVVGVGVKFSDGQSAEFSEHVQWAYRFSPDEVKVLDPTARTTSVSERDVCMLYHVGEKVPVRYDASDRSKIAIDVPARREAALRSLVADLRGQRDRDRQATEQAFASLGGGTPADTGSADAPVTGVAAPGAFIEAAEGAATAQDRPKWVVPAECPNCGARVEQATASAEANPHCTWCREPLPVKPA